MKTFSALFSGLALVSLAPVTFETAAMAQCGVEPCGQSCGPTYRLQTSTVYEERQVTAYKVEVDTIYQEKQVTSYRPVWETQTRERRYTVARPVFETSEREDRYTVLRPVTETRIEDRSYDVARNVFETQEREERYMVQRPVYETQEREERYMVQRPVYETSERDECYTVAEPVTTYRAVQVDQGGYVDQTICRPGAVHNRLSWLPSACAVDPLTGALAYQRGGLAWVPTQAPSQVQVLRVWQPNVVTQQVPETTLVARQLTRKVPVQTCRMVNEEVVRKVPVQVCRMVQEEQVRRVPYTTCRQVVERVENKVPVQVCRMVPEEVVRKVPVTTCKMAYEERVEQEPVRVCRQVAVSETVRIPQCVERRVPVTYTYRVPRTIVSKIPLDACGNDMVPVTMAPSPVMVVPPSMPRAAPPAANRRSWRRRPSQIPKMPPLHRRSARTIRFPGRSTRILPRTGRAAPSTFAPSSDSQGNTK